MSLSLSDRIVAASQNLAALRDKLAEHYTTIDDDNVTDEQMTITQELTAKIAHDQKALDALKDAERHLAGTATAGAGEQRAMAVVGSASAQRQRLARPFSLPAAKKIDAYRLLRARRRADVPGAQGTPADRGHHPQLGLRRRSADAGDDRVSDQGGNRAGDDDRHGLGC